MAYRVKAYTLREESTESGTRYFISFKDGQGKSHELEVSEQFFMEFRQMERRNRNLLQWDERHREFSEVWDETLNRRALKLPKSIEEQMIEAERAELLCKAVDGLPEIQRRRFLLYYEYEFNFYQCGGQPYPHRLVAVLRLTEDRKELAHAEAMFMRVAGTSLVGYADNGGRRALPLP